MAENCRYAPVDAQGFECRDYVTRQDNVQSGLLSCAMRSGNNRAPRQPSAGRRVPCPHPQRDSGSILWIEAPESERLLPVTLHLRSAFLQLAVPVAAH